MKVRTASYSFTILSFAISYFSYLKPGPACLPNSSKSSFSTDYFTMAAETVRKSWQVNVHSSSPSITSHILTLPLNRLNTRKLSRVHLVSTKGRRKIDKNWRAKKPVLCVGLVISFRFYYWYFDALESFGNINCNLVMGQLILIYNKIFLFFFAIFTFFFIVLGQKGTGWLGKGPVSLLISTYTGIEHALARLSPHMHHLQIDAWSIHSQSTWQYNHIVLRRPAQRLTDSLIHFVYGPKLQKMKNPKALEGFQKRADDRILDSHAESCMVQSR